jgi:uncharacterized membrane protein YhfC
MDFLLVAHFLNGFLMVAMPIGLAIYLLRKWKLGARIWWIGAATFVLSQVGHIPFNLVTGKLINQPGMAAWDPFWELTFRAVFLGLSAGLFEEGARFLVLRWWAKSARSWRNGVLFGVGHGGAEAIIFGSLVLFGFFQMAAFRNADLSRIVPASQLELAQSQVTAYWSATWYSSLTGALERLFTIPCQIAMAVLVMQVFTRRHIRWLFLAIGYHALIDALALMDIQYLGVFWTEVIIGGFAILSVVLIFILYHPEPPVENSHPAIGPLNNNIEAIAETPENLEKTRYQ